MKPLVALLLIFLSLVGPASTETLVLEGATIHPVNRAPFRGRLVIESEKIVAVGNSAPPTQASTIDLTGLHLYPSLIDPDTALGLTEIDSIRATVDHSEVGEINPNLEARLAFNSDSKLLRVAMTGGVLVVGVNPQAGLIAGRGSVMRLWGWTWEDMTIESVWSLVVGWPATDLPLKLSKEEKSEDWFEKQGQALFHLKEAFAESLHADPRRRDVKWSSLEPFARGLQPVLVRTHSPSQIKAALAWSQQAGVQPIFCSGPEVIEVLDELASANVAVIFNGLVSQRPARHRRFDAYYSAPATLAARGIPVALSGDGMSWDVRDLRDLAGRAIAYGMSREDALTAVTLTPARLLGVADRLGSLEVGKEATLIACDGDLFDPRSKIVRAWGLGRELSLEDHHFRLYQKYRQRPQGPFTRGQPSATDRLR